MDFFLKNRFVDAKIQRSCGKRDKIVKKYCKNGIRVLTKCHFFRFGILLVGDMVRKYKKNINTFTNKNTNDYEH